MASILKTLTKCCFGPCLYRIHRRTGRTGIAVQGYGYKPNFVEFGSEKVIMTISMCWSLTYWLSPVVLTVLYRRGYFSTEGLGSLLRLTVFLGVTYCAARFLRGVGRLYSTDYVKFLEILEESRAKIADSKRNITEFDFDMSAWPSDYTPNSSVSRVVPKREEESLWTRFVNLPRDAIGYALIYSFGRGMIYPGSTSLVNALLFNTLLEFRGKLIDDQNATRAKISTSDSHYVDTVFLDRRNNSAFPNGNTLILACEGNAGFYEIGCMSTPIEAGYSVLGWNRPGFGQSTGKPDTDLEHPSADAVMQYATNKLGFLPQNIILFAWSIGGYDAAYLATLYPDVKALILDATFDDLVPLAQSKMPAFASGIIEHAIRRYLNLHITPLIKQHLDRHSHSRGSHVMVTLSSL